MSSNLRAELQKLLQQNFEHSDFRGVQAEVLESIWKNQSALTLMPTGMGKSLCFQFPAKVRDGLVLVISPLIALMQDQVLKAKEQGIAASFLSSTLTREEREQRQKQLAQNKFKLFFVTPERFRKSEFLDSIKNLNIQLLAVDEAHCISQWGHDFRPDYSRLGEFRQMLGNPLTLALTATATPQVQQDILKNLNLSEAPIIAGGIERANLSLNVLDVYGLDEKVRAIVALRYQNQGTAIVYCSLIQTLKKISAELRRLNIDHLVYHGDLSPQDRKRNQKLFIESEAPLMIATPAFGLGIDKANVRLLVHAEVSGSVESYFQEVGRAGRDGQLSNCYMLYDQDDVSIQMEFLKWSHPDSEFIRKIYYLIKDNKLRLEQDGFDFLREQMNFRNRRDFRPEASVSILERWGCLEKSNSRFPYSCVTEPTAEMFAAEKGEEVLKTQNRKLLEMVQWAQLSGDCRLNYVYKYFGHLKENGCGICDNCKALRGP